MQTPLRIALVAGETSGDILGSGLMRELKQLHPGVEFLGVGGNLMQAQGLDSLYDMERLAVMGLWEPLKRLPELLSMRRSLIRQFIAARVDLFVGIDSPDFNLGIASALKRAGIKTAHYVSPSVWAWRQGRVRSIRQHLDMMLTLLPFEADFYRQHRVPVAFVGHPLASQIETADSPADERSRQGYSPDPMLLLMPGSRASEVKYLMPVFARAAALLRQSVPELQILVAAANQQRELQIRSLLDDGDGIQVIRGKARELMAASDAVLAASGTTTLEVMLVGRPLVVAYRADPLSYGIISRMLKVPWVGLPNLIAGEQLVPELIQSDATANNLCDALLPCFTDLAATEALTKRFSSLSAQLRKPSDHLAAQTLSNLLANDERS